MPTAQPRNDDLELERREEVTNEWSSPPPRLPPTGRMTPVPSTLPLVSHDVVPNVTHHSHSIIRLVATLIIVAVLALFLFETLFEKKDGGCVHHCDLETTMPPTTAGTPSTETPSATALTPVTSTPAQTKVTSRPSVVGRSGRAPFIDTSYWYFPAIYGTPSVALDSWAADASSSLAMHGPGVSTDADIASHGRSLAEVLPCAAQSRDAKTAYRYPIVFAPVGCFGDPLDGRKCDEVQSTSCKLGVVLAKVVEGCSGAIRVGSLLGDNFYPSGLRKTKDQPRFDHELTQKFWRHESLQMLWLIAVGNHDGRPETQRRVRVGSPLHAELLRAEAEAANASAVEAALATKRPHAPYHPYAHMPDFHHVSEVFTAGGTSVQFFIVNTMWGFAANDGHMPDEAEWLDSALRDSTAKWKIVLSHEPIWGFMNFVHGKGLAQNIHPILVRHGVQFYVCAHQHSVSMHRAPGGYYQVISAGFADNLHDAVKPRRPTGFYHVGRGAVSMLFNASHAVVVAYTDSKKLIFAHAIGLAEVNAAMAGKAAKQNGVKVTVPSAAELLASGRAAQTTRLAKAAAVVQKGPTSMTIPLDWELEGEVTWAQGGPKSIWDPSLTKCDGFLPAKAAGC